MMVLPPTAGVNAGYSTGGGLLDTFKNAVSGASGSAGVAQTDPGPKGDGSIGLFDGVLKKTLLGGAAGVAAGFIPFLPGGPVLGGILGALGGAAMGVFGNWMKINQIKKENEAMLAAMGVQVQDPNVQQILKTGNVEQLIPYLQQQSVQQGVGQVGQVGQVDQVAQTSTGGHSQTGQVVTVTDPDTGHSEQMQIRADGMLVPVATAEQVPQVANPTAQGGGGAAGDAGRPPAPVGVHGDEPSAIAPLQADIAAEASASAAPMPPNSVAPTTTMQAVTPTAVETAAAGADLVAGPEDADPAAKRTAMQALLEQLRRQVEMLERFIESLRSEEPAAA